jgi:hypothetical protein
MLTRITAYRFVVQASVLEYRLQPANVSVGGGTKLQPVTSREICYVYSSCLLF